MEFSIIHFPRSWDAAQDEHVIDAIVEQSLAADQLGFKGVFFPEHHFHGYSPRVARRSRSRLMSRRN